VAAATASGARVAVSVHGDVVTLSPGTGLTAYRLVQEALTNALRHAPGAPVKVDVGYAPSMLSLRVSNPLAGEAKPPGGGYGLSGMRERVELYGGSLTYGPQAGAWMVQGTLPVLTSPWAPNATQPTAALRISQP
jgi:signal transduction histidine kinase